MKNHPKHPRNSPCHCGSGEKYKHCHLLIEREKTRLANLAFDEAFTKYIREAAESSNTGRFNGSRINCARPARRQPSAMLAAAAAMMAIALPGDRDT